VSYAVRTRLGSVWPVRVYAGWFLSGANCANNAVSLRCELP